MKVLITADWQADFSNLEECAQAWEQVLSICNTRNIPTVCVAGDLKRVYNPVDARVAIWWQRAIRKAVKQGIEVVASLGNHDRIGQHSDATNWMPLLRQAGAICVDNEPKLVNVDGGQLAVLPFCQNKKLLRERARILAEEAGHATVLIFHEDLQGCRYNKLGARSQDGIEPEELYPDRYRYCVGGHIHLHQKIGRNIYYVGSPFAQDWGEANQRKGYVVIEDGRIEFLPSTLPGWYDPSWPGFHEPEVWAGCRVRIHVRCRSGVDYIQRVESARDRGTRKYPGAELYIVADFEKSDQTVSLALGLNDPDTDKIREYVRQTCPENINPKQAWKYLLRKVEQVSGVSMRSGFGVEFEWAKAQNFLSYENLELRLNDPGLFVIQGINNDRGGLSNGSGKTSLLSMIPVGLCGSTFKGQKHDGWVRRNSVERAFVKLGLRASENRKIAVVRARRPTKLALCINGKDQSSGMRPQQKDGTQGLIEKVTGFTWQTLANAVYIDQTVSRAFLAGRKSERTAVLNKFQNLERFEKALKLVRDEHAAHQKSIATWQSWRKVLLERIAGYRRTLSILRTQSRDVLDKAWHVQKEAASRYRMLGQELQPRVGALEAKIRLAEARYRECLVEEGNKERALSKAKERRAERQRVYDSFVAAAEYEECPTCHQQVDRKKLMADAKVIKADFVMWDGKIAECLEQRGLAKQETALAEGRHDGLISRLNIMQEKLRSAELEMRHAEKQYRELVRAEHDNQSRVSTEKALAETVVKEKEAGETISEALHDSEFYSYCERALSRDGIPAFLNALMCGPLNVAAEYYAEAFGDKAVQVRFEMENGEFVPHVVNATGGEDIGDQSEGEMALAGLIASFALRETAPKCNLLVLDEPGHGLDPVASRKFAVALKGLKSKFGTIFVTTHNVAMLSEWQSEKSITVVKQNGVSRLL